MEIKHIVLGVVAAALVGLLAGCAAEPKLSYEALPKDGYDGKGFPFVVPRTVVRVVPLLTKENAVESVSFTPVPVALNADETGQLPTYVATDSSTGWSLTPTTVTSVTYADDLVISAIGTQVTDSRKEAIDVIVGVAGMAGAFAGATACPEPRKPPRAFTIRKLEGGAVPEVDCWAYSVEKMPTQFNARKPHPLAELSSGASSVKWFPIPACQEYRVRLFQCADLKCTSTLPKSVAYETVLSLSDGEAFQQVPLPSKGKITLRPDYCGADVTNESVATSNYGLMKQLITDVKAEKKK
ncbi:hypothetical protein LNV47_01615 [Paucibacter sp. DJ4R-1]|nr:hypothetical protein [Paucibacter sp. DJ4R-1]